jgi:Fe/S biogenesis protein NfuA
MDLEITENARAKFLAFLAEEEDDNPAVRITARRLGATRFEYGMNIVGQDDKAENDMVIEAEGLVFWIDPMSAKNLEGATIDYVDGEDAYSSGFKFKNPASDKGWDDPLAQRFQEILDREINPSLASHGGFVELLDLQDKKAFVKMGGGCQGCGMAAVTMSQGIEARIKEALPEIEDIVDTTDHAAGENPYYAS